MPVSTDSSYAYRSKAISIRAWESWADAETYLLHDTSLSLGKGDVTARFVLNEFDLDFSSLATRLIVIIVVVIGGGAGSRALDATIDVGSRQTAIVAMTGSRHCIITGRWRRLLVVVRYFSHGDLRQMRSRQALLDAAGVAKVWGRK